VFRFFAMIDLVKTEQALTARRKRPAGFYGAGYQVRAASG